jgi:hypothetical protein
MIASAAATAKSLGIRPRTQLRLLERPVPNIRLVEAPQRKEKVSGQHAVRFSAVLLFCYSDVCLLIPKIICIAKRGTVRPVPVRVWNMIISTRPLDIDKSERCPETWSIPVSVISVIPSGLFSRGWAAWNVWYLLWSGIYQEYIFMSLIPDNVMGEFRILKAVIQLCFDHQL